MRGGSHDYLTVSHGAQSSGRLLQQCRSVDGDAADPLQEGVNEEEGGEGLAPHRDKQRLTKSSLFHAFLILGVFGLCHSHSLNTMQYPGSLELKVQCVTLGGFGEGSSATPPVTMKLPLTFGWKASSKEHREKRQLWKEKMADMLPRHCW